MARGFPEMMTLAEVAAAFRVTDHTVGRWTAAGKLRSFRTPGVTGHGHHRYFRAEVDAVIAGKPLTSEQLDALVRGESW
jgi:predicted site-specific integrase-resolvase